MKLSSCPSHCLAASIKHHAPRTTLPPSCNPCNPYNACNPSERAIALVIVMISIFVLSMLAGGFAYSMKVETKLARNANAEAELEWLGRSGVEYARWVLANSLLNPMEQHDSLDQPWSTGSGWLGPTNAPIAEVQNPVTLGGGSFTWSIIDLERRFNINSPEPVLQQVLPQALTLMGVDAGEATPIVNSTTGELSYIRMESSLLLTFPSMPAVEVPPIGENHSPRLFELRTYESPNDKTLARKVKMFGDGEIAAFRRCGMLPVFFGTNVIGRNLPSLTYMLAFDDMAAREKAWSAFGKDAGWQKLRATPGLSDPEIVSNISNAFLRPLAFSPIR